MRNALFALLLIGCSHEPVPLHPPDMGSAPLSTVGDDAQSKYPDANTLWTRSIVRTCGPNNGVCHNNRQYPDLQRFSGLLAAIGTRCNLLRSDPLTVDNLCEPIGDSLHIGSFDTRIGQVVPVATDGGAATSLRITLHDPIPAGTTGSVSITRATTTWKVPEKAVMRAQAGEQEIELSYSLLSPIPDGGTSVLADFLLPAVYSPGDTEQVELGDPNGDGVFGYDLGGALIKPGAPMSSYLFLRVLSPLMVGDKLTNVLAPASAEAQMPIANNQYWDADLDVQALWCWISGLTPTGDNAEAPIDYASCDVSKLPTLNHQPNEAFTYSRIYTELLVPSCSSCHFAGTKQPTTFVIGSADETYATLLGTAGDHPSESALPYVTKSDASKSLLYLKLTANPPSGARMPLGGTLDSSLVDGVSQWISQGANNN